MHNPLKLVTGIYYPSMFQSDDLCLIAFDAKMETINVDMIGKLKFFRGSF